MSPCFQYTGQSGDECTDLLNRVVSNEIAFRWLRKQMRNGSVGARAIARVEESIHKGQSIYRAIEEQMENEDIGVNWS